MNLVTKMVKAYQGKNVELNNKARTRFLDSMNEFDPICQQMWGMSAWEFLDRLDNGQYEKLYKRKDPEFMDVYKIYCNTVKR